MSRSGADEANCKNDASLRLTNIRIHIRRKLVTIALRAFNARQDPRLEARCNANVAAVFPLEEIPGALPFVFCRHGVALLNKNFFI